MEREKFMDKEDMELLGNSKSKWGFLFAKGGFDIPFFVLVIALLTIGLIMLFSASYAYAFHHNGGSLHYIKNQLLFAAIGLVVMFVFSRINHRATTDIF